MGLLLVAAFGFFVPNGFFIYWLVYEYQGPSTRWGWPRTGPAQTRL